jgi:hypothetical protein
MLVLVGRCILLLENLMIINIQYMIVNDYETLMKMDTSDTECI